MNELKLNWVLAVATLTAACGGRSVRHVEQGSSDGGSSALGGMSGSGSSGLAGTAGGGSPGLAGRSGGSGTGGAAAGQPGLPPEPCSVGFRLGESPAEAFARDWNGDGHLDVIYISMDQGRVRLVAGKGDGTFSGLVEGPQLVEIPPINGLGIWKMTASDLNADDRLDLVVSSYDAATVSVLLGHGDGTFANAATLAGATRQVVIEDFDGDARADLAFIVSTPRGLPETMLRLHLGNGDGTFGAAMDRVTSGEPGLAAADIDGDGDTDLVLASDAVRVLQGNGDGSFLPGAEYPRMWNMKLIALRDFNADGNLDMLAGFECARGGPDFGSVLLGDGRGLFVPGEFQRFPGCRVPEFGRVDRDAAVDIMTASTRLLGLGDGTFAPPVDLPASGIPGDFNGDGLLDLAASRYESLDVLIGQGDGSFSGCIRTSERVSPPQGAP